MTQLTPESAGQLLDHKMGQMEQLKKEIDALKAILFEPAKERPIPFIQRRVSPNGELVEVPREWVTNGGYDKDVTQHAYPVVRTVAKALEDGIPIATLEEAFPLPAVLAETVFDEGKKTTTVRDAAERLLYSHASDNLKRALNGLRITSTEHKHRNDAVKARNRTKK